MKTHISEEVISLRFLPRMWTTAKYCVPFTQDVYCSATYWETGQKMLQTGNRFLYVSVCITLLMDLGCGRIHNAVALLRLKKSGSGWFLGGRPPGNPM